MPRRKPSPAPHSSAPDAKSLFRVGGLRLNRRASSRAWVPISVGLLVAAVGAAASLSGCADGGSPSRSAANSPANQTTTSPSVATGAATAQANPTVVTNVTGSVLLSTEPWTFGDRTGQLMTSLSYKFYTTSQRQSLLDRLPIFMELALEHYTTTLGPLPRPKEPMETYLLGTRTQWEHMTRQLMGESAGVYLQIQRGGFSSGGKAVLYEIGPRDTFAIAAHEGWHQYTQRTFRTPMPVAFEEALSTFMEGFRWDSKVGKPIFMPWANIERFDQLREAHREGKLRPLHELMRSTPQELIGQGDDAALTFYAQVWALIHFLNEGEAGKYRQSLRELVNDHAYGTVLDRVRATHGGRAASIYGARRQGVDLIELYTGASAEDLNPDYQNFINSIVRVGAKQQIVQGVSPIR